jgi:hypothetical protein
MSQTFKFTRLDQEYIDGEVRQWEIKLRAYEQSRTFKVGDFIVCYTIEGTRRHLVTNSYGVGMKFVVVLVDECGIAFFKRISKNGRAVGEIYSTMGCIYTNDYDNETFQYELDPEYVDSILLETPFDPVAIHKNRADLWKEIGAYNKQNKVDTKGETSTIKYLNSLVAGDIVWTSSKNFLVFVSKHRVSTPNLKFWNVGEDGYTYYSGCRVTVVYKFKNKSGREIHRVGYSFYQKALYKNRPRTYKELKT